jgi:hypothetical protein
MNKIEKDILIDYMKTWRMFDDEILIKKYGSWIKAQVAFYDFIFQEATNLCIGCFKDKCLQEISDGFKDGEFIYEKSIEAIKKMFPTFKKAWDEFLKQI